MNMAEQLVSKIEVEAQKYHDEYFMGFDGDYKDAAVIHQSMFVDTCEAIAVPYEVMADAEDCPRSWYVQVTATDGSTAIHPNHS
jgi:hypothetical protein